MKFVQLILRKIIKIVATRCQILRLKCTKFDFSRGSAPDPAGRAHSTPPDPLAGFEWPISKGGEGKGEGRGVQEGEGRGEEAFLVMWPRRLSALNPPLAFCVSTFMYRCGAVLHVNLLVVTHFAGFKGAYF